MKHHEARKIMSELFSQVSRSKNLRMYTKFRSHNETTFHYGSEMLLYLGPNIRNLVPPEIRNSETLEIFREKKNKKWKPDDAHVGSGRKP